MQLADMPYCGAPPLPADIVSRWNGDPILIAVLLTVLVILRASGANARLMLLVGAIVFLLFVSPLCALSSALFAMRVTHHLALTAILAPLLAAGLPRDRNGGVVRWTALHAVVFWAWHAPAAYAWGLSSEMAYWLMQVSLLGTALLFWRALGAASPPRAVAALLATMMQMGLLGALLTFSGTPIYSWHLVTTQAWGLAPLEDQQLAGLIMWVPGAAIYLAAALRRMGSWLDERQRLARA